MADHSQWTTVGNGGLMTNYDRAWQAEQELKEQQTIATWQKDDNWPSIHKPLVNGSEAKKFDSRLIKLGYLGRGAFACVEKVVCGSVPLALKRITQRRPFKHDDLRKEGLNMRKLDHRHIVKLVATYTPRSTELCLLIWPVAVCTLTMFLDDVDGLRRGTGDRKDILERFRALDISDLNAVEISAAPQSLDSSAKCPLDFLRSVVGCVARALAHCHANGIRHLDIKPSNILLKADRIYLADFGISKDISGQDHTTTDGQPGTERWRAPELYRDQGSSMQLSDIYSLGLVYLNIATVLYSGCLNDFEKALTYMPRENLEEQLRTREDKVKKHIENLTVLALAIAPFRFAYRGQETVRPRPLLDGITRMTAPNPDNRPTAEEIDRELSMLGGMHQIYHGQCCKRPISWVEHKWDRKFESLTTLRTENECLRKRIEELEGKDKTYEMRVQNERRRREEEFTKLQSKLKEAEERCRRLEAEKTEAKRSFGRGTGRTILPTATRNNHGQSSGHVGLGFAKPRSTPATPAARPSLEPSSQSAQRVPSGSTRPWPIRLASPAQGISVSRKDTEPAVHPLPSISNTEGYVLRSRGSGSRLPLPKTPDSRSATPNFTRDPSSTDSSMTSSIFSRRSFETTRTSTQNSPALNADDPSSNDHPDPQWSMLPLKPKLTQRRPSTSVQPSISTPVPSNPTSNAASAVSSPRTSQPAYGLGDVGSDSTMRPSIPSLQHSISWAEVLQTEKGQQKRRM